MNIPSLQPELDARKTDWASNASDEIKRIYAEGISSVEASGILQQAKNRGDAAPDFSLLNAVGKSVRLSELLQQGPVVLSWYRGGWCPYCNLSLRSLQQALPAFAATGASLLALTPELPDRSLSTSEKQELGFEVLSDVGNAVAKQYGIVFSLTSEVAAKYQSSFDLHGYNGDESDELPLAATYVIGQDGIIRYAFLDAEYRNRAEPAEILSVLQGL